MSTQFTWAQVYVPAAIALVISLVAFILSIFIFTQTKSSGNPATIVTSFHDSNGLQGKVNDHILTLASVSSGFQLGADGAFVSAANQDITGKKLIGFDNANPATNMIASDSIINALEKCALLKVTPLTNLAPSFGRVNANNTIFESLQNLAGSYPILSNLFSIYTPTTTNSPTYINLWDNASKTFPANSLLPGTCICIRNFGTIVTSSTTDTISLSFRWDTTSNLIQTTSVLNTSGTRHFLFEINMFVQTTQVAFVHTLYLFNIPGANLIPWSQSFRVTDTFSVGPIRSCGLSGLTSALTTSITLTGSVATIRFKPLPP